jgi:hypothetical protein
VEHGRSVNIGGHEAAPSPPVNFLHKKRLNFLLYLKENKRHEKSQLRRNWRYDFLKFCGLCFKDKKIPTFQKIVKNNGILFYKILIFFPDATEK